MTKTASSSPAPERSGRLWRDPNGGPGLDVDDLAVELALRPPGDKEVHLLLDGVAVATAVGVPLGRPPPAAEALVGDSEVLQAEGLAHEPDLEVVRVHPDLGGHIGHAAHGNDGVVSHRSSFQPAGASLQDRPTMVGGGLSRAGDQFERSAVLALVGLAHLLAAEKLAARGQDRRAAESPRCSQSLRPALPDAPRWIKLAALLEASAVG